MRYRFLDGASQQVWELASDKLVPGSLCLTRYCPHQAEQDLFSSKASWLGFFLKQSCFPGAGGSGFLLCDHLPCKQFPDWLSQGLWGGKARFLTLQPLRRSWQEGSVENFSWARESSSWDVAGVIFLATTNAVCRDVKPGARVGRVWEWTRPCLSLLTLQHAILCLLLFPSVSAWRLLG